MKKFRKKKRGSLLRRYFTISAITVLSAFLFISFVMIFFIAFQWWTDKVDSLSKNAQDIVSIYSLFEENQNEREKNEILAGTLNIMTAATDSDFFIADTRGNMIVCGDCQSGISSECPNHKDSVIDDKTLERAIKGGFSDYLTDDDFGIGRFVVGAPIKNDDGEVEALVFATEDAITGLVPYVSSIAFAFLCCTLFALAIVFIAIFFITRGIAKPLGEMKEVTEHIAKGDFKYRARENYNKRDFNEFAQALNKMADELAIDDEAQKSFIANVSHELKTPMTSIGGFIDGILDGTIAPQEEKKYLSIVSNEIKRLSRMVVSMLNISKMEAGEVQLSVTKYDIGKQIFETLLYFEKRIDEKNISIGGFEDMGEVFVEADRDLIQQVIYNLVDNAVKFTPENGAIYVWAEKDEEYTRVTIRNSGQGVTSEEISRIFERFYKVDKSRSHDTKGFGLGLYIVKTIINMHDGDITPSSRIGEYTQFSFKLPNLQ